MPFTMVDDYNKICPTLDFLSIISNVTDLDLRYIPQVALPINNVFLI